MSASAAQAWFVAGTIPLILAGGLHALAALLEIERGWRAAVSSASRPGAAT